MRVELHREFKPKRLYKGTTIVEDTGWNYVDVYFDDGSKKVMGYIGREPSDCNWQPCHRAPQAVINAIQKCINEVRGGNVKPPVILTTYEPSENE